MNSYLFLTPTVVQYGEVGHHAQWACICQKTAKVSTVIGSRYILYL